MTKRKDGLRDAQSWVQPARNFINMFISVEAGETNLPEVIYILVVAEDTTPPDEPLAIRTRSSWAYAKYLLLYIDNRARWLDLNDK